MREDATILLDQLAATFPDGRFEAAASIDQPTVFVDREHLLDVCRVLRDVPTLNFSFLADLTAVDWLPREPRFEVVYHLACLGEAGPRHTGQAPPRRLRLKVRLAGQDAHLPTVADIWPAAGWAEREVWDLFGIVFDGHLDLRRILMPDDWEGHPLRKDHPVQVNVSAKTYEPLEVTEEEFVANIEAARRIPGPKPEGASVGGTGGAKPRAEDRS